MQNDDDTHAALKTSIAGLKRAVEQSRIQDSTLLTALLDVESSAWACWGPKPDYPAMIESMSPALPEYIALLMEADFFESDVQKVVQSVHHLVTMLTLDARSVWCSGIWPSSR